MRESMMLTLEPIAYNGQARSGVYLAETFPRGCGSGSVVTNAGCRRLGRRELRLVAT